MNIELRIHRQTLEKAHELLSRSVIEHLESVVELVDLRRYKAAAEELMAAHTDQARADQLISTIETLKNVERMSNE